MNTTNRDYYDCPCVQAERCTCGKDCWHFGGTERCAHCNNTGRVIKPATQADAIRRFIAAADAIAFPKPHARRSKLYAEYENAKLSLRLG